MLQAVEAHALSPDAIEQVIALPERDDAAEQQSALTRELKDLDKRIARLTPLIESDAAGDVLTLVARLRELEQHAATCRRS